MTSTQPQIARSSDGATSLVFSVQGRVVERSTSRWRPEVFVAGIYLGCRIILQNAISARFLTASCMHAGIYALTAEVGGRKYTPSVVAQLSGNYFRNRCKPTVAVAGSAACPPACDRSSPSDMPSIWPGSVTHTYSTGTQCCFSLMFGLLV